METDPDMAALVSEMRRENAEYIGVTPEELDEMSLSEILSRIAEKQRQEYIEERWCGVLRFRVRKRLAERFGTNKIMFKYTDEH